MGHTARIAASALLLAATGCAAIDAAKDDAAFAAAAAALPKFPACEAEIKAFVDLTRLARRLGENWRIYEPALDALQDQIIDCVEESYPDPIEI